MNGSREDDCPRVSVAADSTCSPTSTAAAETGRSRTDGGRPYIGRRRPRPAATVAAIETGDGEVILFSSRLRLGCPVPLGEAARGGDVPWPPTDCCRLAWPAASASLCTIASAKRPRALRRRPGT